MAGVSFIAPVTSVAQDTKAKAACCQKAAAGTNTKSANCPMADKEKAKANCPMAEKKNCPMAGKKECTKAGKDCPKANCPMKNGSTVKKSASKSGPVAQVTVK
jgi:hypothetical protein